MDLAAFLRKYDNGAGWFNLARNQTISRQEVEAAGGMGELARDMASLSRRDAARVFEMFERFSLTGGAIRLGDRQRIANALALGLKPGAGGVSTGGSRGRQDPGIIDIEALADAVEWYRQTHRLPAHLEGTSHAGADDRSAPPGHVLNQLDERYRHARIGRSQSTIRAKGCLLATMTMAGNRLTGTRYDLIESNRLILAANGFEGAALYTHRAAAALGIRIESRVRATARTVDAAAAELDRGKLLFAGVDYKPNQSSSAVSEADHFLLIVGREGDKLIAVDPAGGRRIAFTRHADGTYRWNHYRITEVAVMSRAAEARPS